MSGKRLYELLLDHANLGVAVERVQLGVNWTLCQAGASGLASTLGGSTWASEAQPLHGRPLAELAAWLSRWDRQQASVGLAAVNAALNREADMVYASGTLYKGQDAAQSAFDTFLPWITGQRVAVIGPVLPFSTPQPIGELHLFAPAEGALGARAESLLPQADWLFVHAQTLADKTLPRILELAEGARCVLYGAQTPWLDELHEFGIDYLLGVQIDEPQRLHTVVAEGGDLANLAHVLSFRLLCLDKQAGELNPFTSPASARAGR